MGDHSVQVYVNPLIYFGSEFRPEGLTEGDASYASMMGFICAPGTDSQVPALIARYNEISVEKNRLPAETRALVFENLATIDRAIAEIEKALAAEPANAALGRTYIAYREREIDLLRQANRTAARL